MTVTSQLERKKGKPPSTECNLGENSHTKALDQCEVPICLCRVVVLVANLWIPTARYPLSNSCILNKTLSIFYQTDKMVGTIEFFKAFW